jgi:hypothetical protein
MFRMRSRYLSIAFIESLSVYVDREDIPFALLDIHYSEFGIADLSILLHVSSLAIEERSIGGTDGRNFVGPVTNGEYGTLCKQVRS